MVNGTIINMAYNYKFMHAIDNLRNVFINNYGKFYKENRQDVEMNHTRLCELDLF